MGVRLVELQSKTQKSFYGKVQICYKDGSSSLFSYGKFIVKVEDGSVVDFSKDENHYSRTTMKHLNDSLEYCGLDRTNLAEVRLSIENGMDKLVKLVEEWSYDRGSHKADSSKQFLKVIEEIGEVADALAKGKPEELKDGIGDVIVTLIILAQQQRLTVEECLAFAYDEIKNREGKMVNGVFVKKADL